MRIAVIAVAASLAVSGCAPVAAGLVGTALTVATAAGPVLMESAKLASAVGPLMTDAEKLACAGQAAANAATDAATRLNHPDAASYSSAVSRTLGFGCTWL